MTDRYQTSFESISGLDLAEIKTLIRRQRTLEESGAATRSSTPRVLRRWKNLDLAHSKRISSTTFVLSDYPPGHHLAALSIFAAFFSPGRCVQFLLLLRYRRTRHRIARADQIRAYQ